LSVIKATATWAFKRDNRDLKKGRHAPMNDTINPKHKNSHTESVLLKKSNPKHNNMELTHKLELNDTMKSEP